MSHSNISALVRGIRTFAAARRNRSSSWTIPDIHNVRDIDDVVPVSVLLLRNRNSDANEVDEYLVVTDDWNTLALRLADECIENPFFSRVGNVNIAYIETDVLHLPGMLPGELSSCFNLKQDQKIGANKVYDTLSGSSACSFPVFV